MLKKILLNLSILLSTMLWGFCWLISALFTVSYIVKLSKVIFIYKGGLYELLGCHRPDFIDLTTGKDLEATAWIIFIKVIGLIYLLFSVICLANILRKYLKNIEQKAEGGALRPLYVDKPLLVYHSLFWFILISLVFFASVNNLRFIMNPLVLMEEDAGPFVQEVKYEGHKIKVYYNLSMPLRQFLGKEIYFTNEKGEINSRILYGYPYNDGNMIMDLDGDGLKEVVVSLRGPDVWFVNEKGEFEESRDGKDNINVTAGFELLKYGEKYIFKNNKTKEDPHEKYFMWSRKDGLYEISYPF